MVSGKKSGTTRPQHRANAPQKGAAVTALGDPDFAPPTGAKSPTETLPGDSPENPALLVLHGELTSRLQKFTEFWRKKPVQARFEIQDQARQILGYDHRVSKCKRVQISANNPVIGFRGFDASGNRTAHYGNLQTCGIVWACPVCAAKITARRLEELQTGVAHWQSAGNEVFLATFTLQHRLTDPCGDVLKSLIKSHERFWGNRAGRKIAADFKIRGKVRGLEVTYTANGWHWHHHVLLFVEGLLPPNEQSILAGEAGRAWSREVAASGAFADSDHGFDLRRADGDIGEYFTKHGHLPKKPAWGIANEAALSPVKRAALGGVTPFELVVMAGLGQQQAGRLFAEYAAAVRGKSYLKWSNGLRALVGLGQESTDQELAEEFRQPATRFVDFEHPHWDFIKKNRMRGKVFELIRKGDWAALLDCMSEPDLPPLFFPEVDFGLFGSGID